MAGNPEPHAVEPRDAGFLPISLASLRLDSVTHFDIYFQPRPDQPYVLYAEKNIKFTEEVRRRLIENRIDTVYIRANQRSGYNLYIEENLPSILADANIPAEEKAEMLYSSSCGVVETVLANPESLTAIRRSRDMVRHTVDFMIADRRMFGFLLKTIASSYKVHTHCMNVVTYSVALAQRAGFSDPATLRELAVGALLHDVGKSKIDSTILYKATPLTDHEWEIMKRHPALGHDILNEAGSIGEIALDIVLHHHEKFHGSGYPDNLTGTRISELVRIVTIADTFDAMTTDRPFQSARTSFTALSTMNIKHGADFDRSLLKVFVGMMGHPGQ